MKDPDRLAAYLDVLNNWKFEGYILFTLGEPSHRWIERNLGSLEYREIKRLMFEHVVLDGGEIDEVRENNKDWQKLHEFHYDLRFTIQGIQVYIETRLIYRPPFEPDEPVIEVVSVHEPKTS